MKAFINLISNVNYLEGVLVLNESLKKVNSAYPLYCMLSKNIDDVTEAKLVSFGINCIRLNKSVIDNNKDINDGFFTYWNFTFDKLLI